MVTHLTDWEEWIRPKPLSQRLQEKTIVGPIPTNRPDLGPCMVWTGTRLNGYKGLRFAYGQLNIHDTTGKVRKILAHRLSYELSIGRIPDGMDLDHLCKVTLCVNPDHLEPVSKRENFARGNGNIHKTHCPQGHPYNEANTRYVKGRWGMARTCKTCENAYMRRYNAGHPASMAAKHRAYYLAHREEILAKAKAKRRGKS